MWHLPKLKLLMGIQQCWEQKFQVSLCAPPLTEHVCHSMFVLSGGAASSRGIEVRSWGTTQLCTPNPPVQSQNVQVGWNGCFLQIHAYSISCLHSTVNKKAGRFSVCSSCGVPSPLLGMFFLLFILLESLFEETKEGKSCSVWKALQNLSLSSQPNRITEH